MRFDQKAAVYSSSATVQELAADWCADLLGVDYSTRFGLELGAGTGFLTRHLAKRNFSRLLATDVSENMLRIGRNSIPDVEWQWMDAWQPEGIGLDGLYSSSLLQWAADPAAVLKKWREVLKDSGELLISLFLEGSLQEFTGIDGQFTAIEWMSERTFRTHLVDSGFSIRRCDTREETFFFKSAKHALRSLHDTGAVEENRMSVSELGRFLEDCDRKYGNQFPVTWRICRALCIAV